MWGHGDLFYYLALFFLCKDLNVYRYAVKGEGGNVQLLKRERKSESKRENFFFKLSLTLYDDVLIKIKAYTRRSGIKFVWIKNDSK